MEHIAVYCSSDSNEGSEEDAAIEDQSNRAPTLLLETGQYERTADVKATNAPINSKPMNCSKSSKLNFFGLVKDREKESEHQVDNVGVISGCVNIQGCQIQIPEGDFWQQFSQSDITNKCLENKYPHKRKYSYLLPEQPSSEFSGAKIINVPKINVPLNKTCSEVGVVHSQSFLNRQSSVEREHIEREPGTDKVYTVHPKVAPYLHLKQANRYPLKLVREWAGHEGAVNRIAWCSAQAFSHLLLSASMDTTVNVWSVWAQQQPCVRTLSVHSKAVRDAVWSEDGHSILSSSYDRTAAISDVQTGVCLTRFDHSTYVSAGKFHPVTPHIIATGANDFIQVWDIRAPEVPCRIFSYKEKLGQVQDLLFSHDGQVLFSCCDNVTRDSADRTIMAWDFRTGVTLSNQIFQERYPVTRLQLHPNWNEFLAQTQGGYIALFSTQRPYKMNKCKRFEGHKTAGYNIGFCLSQDGSLVYSGSEEGKVHCYNFQNAKQIRTLNCGDVVMDVAAHPVLSSLVACATWNGTLCLFQ